MVVKVEFHVDRLFPRVGFIVTNLEAPSPAVERFYNKRAEQWIKEGKQTVKIRLPRSAAGQAAAPSAQRIAAAISDLRETAANVVCNQCYNESSLRS